MADRRKNTLICLLFKSNAPLLLILIRLVGAIGISQDLAPGEITFMETIQLAGILTIQNQGLNKLVKDTKVVYYASRFKTPCTK